MADLVRVRVLDDNLIRLGRVIWRRHLAGRGHLVRELRNESLICFLKALALTWNLLDCLWQKRVGILIADELHLSVGRCKGVVIYEVVCLLVHWIIPTVPRLLSWHQFLWYFCLHVSLLLWLWLPQVLLTCASHCLRFLHLLSFRYV